MVRLVRGASGMMCCCDFEWRDHSQYKAKKPVRSGLCEEIQACCPATFRNGAESSSRSVWFRKQGLVRLMRNVEVRSTMKCFLMLAWDGYCIGTVRKAIFLTGCVVDRKASCRWKASQVNSNCLVDILSARSSKLITPRTKNGSHVSGFLAIDLS